MKKELIINKMIKIELIINKKGFFLFFGLKSYKWESMYKRFLIFSNWDGFSLMFANLNNNKGFSISNKGLINKI